MSISYETTKNSFRVIIFTHNEGFFHHAAPQPAYKITIKQRIARLVFHIYFFNS